MEAPLNFLSRPSEMKKFAIFYGLIRDTDEDGVFFDYPYFGGETYDKTHAEIIASGIVNDSSMPGTVVVKIVTYTCYHNCALNSREFENVLRMVTRQFLNMARSLYESEEMQKRGRRSYKKKTTKKMAVGT